MDLHGKLAEDGAGFNDDFEDDRNSLKHAHEGFNTGRDLDWVTRNAEDRLLALVTRPASFIHITGRRRTGKSRTLRTVQRRAARPAVYVDLDDCGGRVHLKQFKHAFEAIGITCNAESEGELMEPLLHAIRAGVIVAIDEIQRATAQLQHVLQVVVDDIEYEVQAAGFNRSKYGSLVVLGSLPLEVDTVLEGADKPLFGRFTQKIRFTPFLATELADIFLRCGVKSGWAMLAIYAATGGMPALLNCLARHTLLSDDVMLKQAMKALYASNCDRLTTAMASWCRDELPNHFAALQCIIGPGKGLPVSEQTYKLQCREKCERSSASWMLQTLCNNHGSIIKLGPISPAVCAATTADDTAEVTVEQETCSTAHSDEEPDVIRETYVVDDTALLTFHELNIHTQSSSEDGVHTLITASDEDCAFVEGLRLKRWVRAIIVQRFAAGYSSFPGVTHWTQPHVLRGVWAGLKDTEIDLIALFHEQKTVVFGTVERDPREMFTSLLNTTHSKSLRSAVQRLRAALQDCADRRMMLTREEKAMLRYEAHLVGITTDLNGFDSDPSMEMSPSAGPVRGVSVLGVYDLPQLLRFEAKDRWKVAAVPSHHHLRTGVSVEGKHFSVEQSTPTSSVSVVTAAFFCAAMVATIAVVAHLVTRKAV